jgi:dTDP-4-dehydrorhamnose 3,5-epimerase
MNFISTDIPGCFELVPDIFTDERGSFVKTFQRDLFAQQGLEIDWREEYHSISRKGVLRGLHFQLPPYEHAKLVYCNSGEVLDVVLDLRVGSPAYGCHAIFQLNGLSSHQVYIPKGCAHAFYTLTEQATMIYKVGTVHAPAHDAGLLWNSAGIPWLDDNPIMSDRDKAFPAFAEFTANPFRYQALS